MGGKHFYLFRMNNKGMTRIEFTKGSGKDSMCDVNPMEEALKKLEHRRAGTAGVRPARVEKKHQLNSKRDLRVSRSGLRWTRAGGDACDPSITFFVCEETKHVVHENLVNVSFQRSRLNDRTGKLEYLAIVITRDTHPTGNSIRKPNCPEIEGS